MVGSSVLYEVVPHVEYKEEEIVTATVVEENNWVDDLQFGLDLVGLIPVIGEPADLLNAIIYAGRGDTVNAALSVGGMLPVAGWFSTGGKWVYKSTTNVKQVKNVVSTDAMKSIYTPVYQQVINSPLGKTQNQLNLLTNVPYQLGTPNHFTFNRPLAKTDIPATSKIGDINVKVEMKNVDIENKSLAKVQTGGRELSIDEYLRQLDNAEEMYESFRKSKNDVQSIAKNTGMPEQRIQRIKEHIKEHGIGRFESDYQIAQAQDRLQKGKHTKNDINLLNHELFESKFEGIFKTDYRTAHDKTVESGRPWYPEEE